MSRINKQKLQELSKKELLEMANINLGMGLKATTLKKDIINYIVHNTNRMGSDVPEFVKEEEVKETKNTDLPVGYAIVRLEKGRYNPSGRPLYVGSSNTRKQSNCLIPVGHPVKIHEKFLSPLLDAVRVEVMQDPVTLEEEEREVHNYPFTILRHNPSPKWVASRGNDLDLGYM